MRLLATLSRHPSLAAIAILVAAIPARALADATPTPPDAPPPPPVEGPAFLPPPPPQDATAPLAGYSDRNVFLRDRNDWFVLMPKGRLNVDWYNFLNVPAQAPGAALNGPKDTDLPVKDTVFLRRARLGLSGTIARVVDWRLEAEFASLATPGQYATLTDASIAINYVPWLQLEAGQFYAPFTLENNTSENWIEFMERSATVRFAVPGVREVGAQLEGTLPHRIACYSFGVFNGEGQNFKNQDYAPAFIGRATLSPLALVPHHPDWFEDVWIGGSFWYQLTQNQGGFIAPSTSGATQNDLAPVTTQGGLSVFSSSYGNGVDAMGNAIRAHLAPDGTTFKWALELNVPIGRFGLRAEYVHQSIDVRQYDDVSGTNGTATRATGPSGLFSGDAFYVQAYVWITDRMNIDPVGRYATPHWRGFQPPTPPRFALQLVAKYEHLDFGVSGLPSMGTGATAKADPANGHYQLDVIEVGATLWLTRHAKLMANYVFNYIGAGDDRTGAANEKKNVFFQSADHELLFRLAMQL